MTLLPSSTQAATKRYGTRGLSIWSGIIREEYVPALKDWSRASKIYLEMQDDVIIATLLDAIIEPLLAAEFDVTPGGEAPGDQAAATFLWDNMTNMHRQTWRSHVRDMLESIAFGFAVAEIVLEKRADGRMWLKNADPRGQETLVRWDFDGDDVTAFVQRPLSSTMTAEISIPMEKLVHVIFRGRKGNPMGQPLLRSLYRSWRFLKNLENLEGVGVERDVGGMPIFEEPPETLMTTEDETAIDDMLKAIRVDETASVRIPAGAKLTAYGGGNKMYDVGAIIERKKKEILMRFFAQFLTLGMDKVGTQALVKGSHDFFGIALQAVQQELLESWQQQLVPFLFRFNDFPGITKLPVIQWHDPGKVDITAIVGAFAQGASSGLLTAMPEDEDYIRGAMDLPDRPEELPQTGGTPLQRGGMPLNPGGAPLPPGGTPPGAPWPFRPGPGGR